MQSLPSALATVQKEASLFLLYFEKPRNFRINNPLFYKPRKIPYEAPVATADLIQYRYSF